MDNKQIGKNLEQARLKVKLNKRQFAKIAGVDASQYGRVERGEEGFGRENLLLIAEKHGLSIEFLSTGKGPILIAEAANRRTPELSTPPVETISELTTGQIISVLAQALKDQAKAFADQAEIMKSIESKMARQDSQATIADAVKRIESNLTETLTGVEFVSGRQLMKIIASLEELKAHKTQTSPGARKKSDENDGDGHKSGIKS